MAARVVNRRGRGAAMLVAAVMLAASSTRAAAGTVGGSATVDGAPADGAVVYLERAAGAGPAPAGPPEHAVMDQKNLAFVPPVLPVVRGSVVEFTNSDDVAHNVFSPSAAAGKFNLGTYGPGAARSVTFDEPGDVLVLCNIHMEMEAHILVLDTPYFAAVAKDGRYEIRDVPAGTYTAKLWQRRSLPFTQAVEVPATGTLTVNVAAGK